MPPCADRRVGNLPEAGGFQDQEGSCLHCWSHPVASLKGSFDTGMVILWTLSEAPIMDELDTHMNNTLYLQRGDLPVAMSISGSIHHQNCEHLSNVNKNTALVNETCSQMGQKITNWEEAAKKC